MWKGRTDPEQIAAKLQQIEALLVRGVSRRPVLCMMLTVSFILFTAVLAPLIGKKEHKDATIWVLYIVTSLKIRSSTRTAEKSGIMRFRCCAFQYRWRSSIFADQLYSVDFWRSPQSGWPFQPKLYVVVMCPGVFLMFLLYEECARQPKVIIF